MNWCGVGNDDDGGGGGVYIHNLRTCDWTIRAVDLLESELWIRGQWIVWTAGRWYVVVDDGGGWYKATHTHTHTLMQHKNIYALKIIFWYVCM